MPESGAEVVEKLALVPRGDFVALASSGRYAVIALLILEGGKRDFQNLKSHVIITRM